MATPAPAFAFRSGAHDLSHSAAMLYYGDQFVVRCKMDVTIKASGERRSVDEGGVYTIRNGIIVEERFFYGG